MVAFTAAGAVPAGERRYPPSSETAWLHAARSVRTTVTFVPSLESHANPERGFTGNIELVPVSSVSTIRSQMTESKTVMRAYIMLRDFVARDLTPEFLAQLDQGFANVRAAGAKVVPRFAYNFPNDLNDPAQIADASITQALRHIEQLRPVLQRNADVIAYLEAGFVGAWGEWHTSGSGLTSAENKQRIRDALLGALPNERMVLFRLLADIKSWFSLPAAGTRPTPGTAQARVGIHNDCFMSTDTDAGTYRPDNTGLREYARQVVKFVPFGGETCDIPPGRTACADILREGRDYAVTYLNNAFYRPTFHERWIANGCMPEVMRSLGYRIVAESFAMPATARRGEAVEFSLTLRNLGWARIHNPRSFVLRLVNRSTGATVELPASGIDPRQWNPVLATEPSTVATGRIALAADMSAGTYDVAIGLPDPASSLAADARYAIRVSNADDSSRRQRWDAPSGRFFTGLSITVQ